MRRELHVSTVALLAAVAILVQGCREGQTPAPPPSWNFTILTQHLVTFTGLQSGTFLQNVSTRFYAQSHAPYGPGLVGSVYDFIGESTVGVYRVVNGVVPARWAVDQLSGPCSAVPGTISTDQIHLGGVYESVCAYTQRIIGLTNVNGDGIVFDGGCCDTDTMTAGMSLTEGQTITSQNGEYVLVYQGDGNLVVYRWSDGVPMWHAGTNGTVAGSVDMQSDGNFVVYASGAGAVWHASTYGNPGAYVRLNNDGSLVVYSAGGGVLWSSTGGGGGPTGRWKDDGNGGCYWDPNDSGPNQCQPH